MYEYKSGNMNATIILGHITSAYYNEDASTFDVYLIDKGEPNSVPAKYYDDFMSKLKAYVKSQA